MLNKLTLSLDDAMRLAGAADEAAKKLNMKVSIAIVDASTYAQVLLRQDGAPLMSAEGALDKARTAAEGGHPTTFFEDVLNAGRVSMLAMPHTPLQGGLPVIVEQQCVGAIGVAGAPPHLDEQIAQQAIDQFMAHIKA
jgi:glc operon protein GlcG